MIRIALIVWLLLLVASSVQAKTYELHLVFKFFSSKGNIIGLENLKQNFLVNAPGAMYLNDFEAFWEDEKGNIGIKMKHNNPVFSLVFKDEGKYMFLRLALNKDFPNCNTYILDRLLFTAHSDINEAITLQVSKRSIQQAGIANITPKIWQNPLKDSRWQLIQIDSLPFHNFSYYISFVGDKEFIYSCALRDNVTEGYFVKNDKVLKISVSGVCTGRGGSTPLLKKLQERLNNLHRFEIITHYEKTDRLSLKQGKRSLVFKRIR